MRRYACLPATPVTEGEFALVTVQDEHIEAIRCWRNAQIDVLRQAEPISPDQQVQYYAQQIWPSLNLAQPRNILVSYLRDGRPIGYGGLVHLAWEHRRGEVSFLLTPELAADPVRYPRYFALYLRLLQRVAFEHLGLQRLCTETYAFRTSTIEALEGAGFRLEGRLRRHVIVDGHPVDALMHGCLLDEWAAGAGPN